MTDRYAALVVTLSQDADPETVREHIRCMRRVAAVVPLADDELVDDQVGRILAARRWMADIMRLFRGRLERARDGR
jgi:hypothetical protein